VSACFLSDTVLLGRKSYGLTRYDLTNPGQAVELPSSLLAPERYNLCIAHRPGMFAVGKRIGYPPYELRILTGDRGELVEKMKLPVENITLLDLDFDLAGERLAVVYADGALQVFDVKSGKPLLKVPGKFDRAAFATGNTIVAISQETRQAYKLIQIDAANGTALNTVDIRFRISAFAVSPDQRLAAVAGSDQSVHLFDAHKLIETTSFRAHDGDITALAFHPTAPLIATAAMDHSLKLWDYTSARLVNQFIGLRGTPVVLSFNPSGSLIVADGQEYTTRVFGTATDLVKVKRK
jgi:WD40 repeat protein